MMDPRGKIIEYKFLTAVSTNIITKQMNNLLNLNEGWYRDGKLTIFESTTTWNYFQLMVRFEPE